MSVRPFTAPGTVSMVAVVLGSILLLFPGDVILGTENQLPLKLPKKNVLIIAGPITGHGKNTHEYEKSAVLLKHLLDRSSNFQQCQVSVVFDGWPDDPKLLQTADTIVMISDGGDRREADHPLYVDDRFAQLEKQMKRGCGLVQLHWSTFHPSRFHDKITEWVGGYFDYEKGTASNGWYSAIKHYTEPIRIGEPKHAISRGVRPFRLLEEFYYRIRFRENDPRLKKIVLSRPSGEANEYAVGWSVERKDGGRGFGFTGGHYYANWWDSNFRKLILNAIVWTAGAEVPKEGVQSKLEAPIKALIVTGYNHPAHDWSKTSAALLQVIENDPRILVDVSEDPEILASEKLAQYNLLVMNYSSWDRKGISEKGKIGLVNYLKKGGGLNVIHFANGSWTDTLPNKESDWPEYRTKIVRRVWDHGSGKSGHDAFGDFRVAKTEVQHPVTDGLVDFNTRDELYYRQVGPLPITPLLTAKSRDTGKNEPMAWAYQYENAKVFQTVLGHADVSILMAGDLIRRAAAWSAGLESLSFDPAVARKTPYLWRAGGQWKPNLPNAKSSPTRPAKQPPQSEGKFGKALNAKSTSAFLKSHAVYHDPNLTLECWIKIDSKTRFNIIAASETKSSLKHWELYTYANSGVLSVYMPGIFGEIKSDRDVCDGKWHYVGMTFEKQFVKLYVDGKLVKSQPINFRKHPDTTEGFAIGNLVEKSIGCDGLIDDLRISSSIRKLHNIPTKPLTVDKETVGLWRFDQLDETKSFADQSKLKNAAQTDWSPVAAKPNIKTQTGQPKKITGHWGEDAIGFRWTEKQSEDNRWAFTKHGWFLASTIPLPGGFAEKGLVIKVGEKQEGSVCYDLKRLNLMAAWSGGFLEFNQARFGLIRHLRPVGSMLFHNQSGLGWNVTDLQYRGLYTQGKRQVLSYSIGQTSILESPWLEKSDETGAISREFEVGKNASQLMIPVSSFPGATSSFEKKMNGRTFRGVTIENDFVSAVVIGGQSQANIQVRNRQLWLAIEKNGAPVRFKVLIWRGPKEKIEAFEKLVASARLSNQAMSTDAGKPQWTEEVKTVGVTGEQSALGYTIDTIRLPFQNPYNSLFFVSGHDWFPNGTMAIATVHGEIWLAKNVDAELKNVQWKRFATGLYQPLGVKIVDEKIFVLCRDQIVKLHDRNKDDEADFYECFHADVTTSTGVHDYVCCLEVDDQGNFYYIHANDGVVRVSPDGESRSVVATGFRNPNGMGVRSDGLVTAAPQEGEWTPASMVCEVIEGRHYGYRGPREKTEQTPLGYEKPLVFLPRMLDNSSGGQFWSESDRWGILKNQLFHLSYGKCTLHLVVRDVVDSSDPNALKTQGAVVPLPFVFESGVCRGRFSPHDGQLYVSGLKGWTTSAVRDGSLQRVRLLNPSKPAVSGSRTPGNVAKKDFPDKATFLPIRYKVFSNGIQLGFSHAIDPESIRPQAFSIQAWNYRYSKNYGSPEFKISSPNQQGRDPWLVNSVRLFNSDRDLFIEIPGIGIADQVAISMKLKSKLGVGYDSTVFATIKYLRNESLSPGKPFASGIVDFGKQLQQGVYVKSHDWTKNSLDVFVAKNAEIDRLRIANGVDPTQGLSMTSYLKLEDNATRLFVLSGPSTVGVYQITPIRNNVSNRDIVTGSIGGGEETKIDLSGIDGYCRIDFDLTAKNGDLKCQWSWSGDAFAKEPIPSRAIFYDQQWRKNATSQEYAGRFLEAGQLFLDNQCTRCHDLGQDSALASKTDYRLGNVAPDLVSIGSRRSPDFLVRKILEPAFESHGARMPALFDSNSETHRQDAVDMASYLATLSKPNDKTVIDHVSEKQIESGEKLFEELGCIGCHHLPIESSKDPFDRLSLKYTAAKFSPPALREFLQNPQLHAPMRRMGNFGLSPAEAHLLAGFIEKYSTSKISSVKNTFGRVNLARGKELIGSSGCLNCHQVSNESQTRKLVLIANTGVGCLDTRQEISAEKVFPRLKLTNDQKQLLAFHVNEFKGGGAFTKSSIHEALASTPLWKQSMQIMESLRCTTCHSTGHSSARLPEIIYEEGVVGLNPERLPNLGQVGHKLQKDWLENLLAGKHPIPARPWLKTRMPHFPGYSNWISNGLENDAGFDHRLKKDAPKIDPKMASIGNRLTSQTNGLDCRQCHGVGSEPPRGDEKTQVVLGVNFSSVYSRIRRSYYDRWMMDPLRIDPQTKMPKYSTDGRSTKITEVLSGDAKQQFNVIWEYLESVSRE